MSSSWEPLPLTGPLPVCWEFLTSEQLNEGRTVDLVVFRVNTARPQARQEMQMRKRGRAGGLLPSGEMPTMFPGPIFQENLENLGEVF